MDQRIPHQMETHQLSQRSDLLNDFSKEIHPHELLVAHDCWAKTALQIADIGDLDVDLRILSH
jgi:hypothetical protein